jgi:hypothetical protein
VAFAPLVGGGGVLWFLSRRGLQLPGSIWRDCLDHVVVLNERQLKRILTSYFDYYHRWRTHLSLGMDSPETRSVQPPALGKVVHNQKSAAYIIIMNGWRHD